MIYFRSNFKLSQVKKMSQENDVERTDTELNDLVSQRPGPKPNTQYRKLFQGYDIQHSNTTLDPKVASDLDELREREKSVNDYRDERVKARAKWQQCKTDAENFRELLERSKLALTVREPDPDQQNTINELQSCNY